MPHIQLGIKLIINWETHFIRRRFLSNEMGFYMSENKYSTELKLWFLQYLKDDLIIISEQLIQKFWDFNNGSILC